ncbi:MAG: Gldg family protein [Planctomycetota bacterium]|jgi:ABC-2 type transport system permease protein
MPRPHVIRAVFWKDYSAYFSNPTGYVFITVFVLLGGLLAFWPPGFFAGNLANLDTLNKFFPFLVLFLVPAISMGLWADERRQGTDELMLTLPATDFEIVLGKYKAGFAIYLTALLFSLTHVIVLLFLGSPDAGLMLSTYLAYAFLGGALLSVAMVGSLLSSSMTVAFIVGALFCAAAVFTGPAASLLGIDRDVVSILFPFRELTSGVLSLKGVAALVAVTTVMLYINVRLLWNRRRGREPAVSLLGILFLVLFPILAPVFGVYFLLKMDALTEKDIEATWHEPARFVAVAAIAISVAVLVGRVPLRLDLTSERLTSLSGETRRILSELPDDRPVYIRAFVSPEVPREYVQVRSSLLTLVREFEARSGGTVVADIRSTEPYSPEASEAKEKFGIGSATIASSEGGGTTVQEVFLGVAFSCGGDEVIVPFLHKGIPVEYELARSIRVVSQLKRKKLGVLSTDARVSGGFDFQSMGTSSAWSIIRELRKQYDVVDVSPDAVYPGDLDVLLAVLPSSLTQEQMSRFSAYVESGNPTLILDDPIPAFNPRLAPSQPKGGNRNPFMGGQQQSPPKGDIRTALSRLGLKWSPATVAWDLYNPHPELRMPVPPEIIFVGPGSGSKEPFNDRHAATSGMQEVVFIFPGYVEAESRPGIEFVPLISTGPDSGSLAEQQILSRNFFGGIEINPRRPHRITEREYLLAAGVTGSWRDGKKEVRVRAAFLADVDVISEQFFDLRREGGNLEFDNVSLALNLIDLLADDPSFVELRKRRVKHRTLDTVEEYVKMFERECNRKITDAEERAEGKLKEAQDRLNKAVGEVRNRKDLDETAKKIMVRQKEESENRKLAVARANIEEEKERAVYLSRTEKERKIGGVETNIRFLAVGLPFVANLIVAVIVLVVRVRRQRSTEHE